ncbi:hypothetical protein WMQ40_00200 [Vibrio diabolicus]|uniref:hypothetical protein n=1 Tax=Vibrio diabolicus TaxID=50719 RepID=UPI001D84C9CB|nr:hypothetical protein [Vibrio parahaemolyticus]EJG1091307.1 hypothetical protein [Vibrio parahaemolyticus]EJG1727745.1 hypothetical protein [Vibrio parahaemolyticus]HCE1242917.1 hypothetical protein [Vibrio parahaemolyticus]HCG6226372.1 hypothetical protein [Vibrio parahaemolyticus]
MRNFDIAQPYKYEIQTKHKLKRFHIYSALIKAIPLSYLEPDKALGIYALIQHTLDCNREHDELRTYTPVTRDFTDYIFGHRKIAITKDNDIKEIFHVFGGNFREGYSSGLKLKAKYVEAVNAMLRESNELITVSLSPIYKVELMDSSTYFSPDFKAITNWVRKNSMSFAKKKIGLNTIRNTVNNQANKLENCKSVTTIPYIPSNPINSTHLPVGCVRFETAALKRGGVKYIEECHVTSCGNGFIWTTQSVTDITDFVPVLPASFSKYSGSVIKLQFNFNISQIDPEEFYTNYGHNERLVNLFDRVYQIILEHPSQTHIYHRHNFGRWYVKSPYFNIQTIPKEIRKAITVGYSMYDLSTAHPAIMVGIAKHYGYRLPHWEQYINRKTYFRNKWHHAFSTPSIDERGIYQPRFKRSNKGGFVLNELFIQKPRFDIPTIKSVLTSIQFGSKLGNDPRQPDSINECRRCLRSVAFVQGLLEEVKVATKVVIKHYEETMKLQWPTSEMSDKQKLACVMQHYESAAMASVSNAGIVMHAYYFDGFQSDKLSKDDLQAANKAIENALGFSVNLEEN